MAAVSPSPNPSPRSGADAGAGLERIAAMKFIRANGVVVCCSDEGRRDGPALVFINALGSDLRIWDDVARHPLARLPHRPLRQARPRPFRARPRPAATSPITRGDLAALMDALGVERATVVGLSIGGLVAQELYRQRPELLRRAGAFRHRRQDRHRRVRGTRGSPMSSAAGSRRSPTRFSSAGSPPTSAPAARTSSPAGGRC